MKILSPNWELLSIEDNEGFSAFANLFINFMAYYVTVVPNIAIISRRMPMLDINLKLYWGNFEMFLAETDIPRIEKYISAINSTDASISIATDASISIKNIVKSKSTFFDTLRLETYGVYVLGNPAIIEFINSHLIKEREMSSVVNITNLMELISENQTS